jgi:hypothetical protein
VEHYTTKQHGFPILHSSAKHAWFDFNAQRVECNSAAQYSATRRQARWPNFCTQYTALQHEAFFSNNRFSSQGGRHTSVKKSIGIQNLKAEATKPAAYFLGLRCRTKQRS